MAYVDSYVVPVPKKNLEKYREFAELSGKIWMEHGALEYHDCLADDAKAGEVTSFPQSVQLQADEIVAFGWTVYESREHRDRVNEKVMKDPRMASDLAKMPFDGKRMFFGGFKSVVDL